ncbi:MAG: hypothetical protein H0V96_12810 [Acidimicrobiia bacterium]|nr:hypothetical protein [Acidimicrobiia bacterium]
MRLTCPGLGLLAALLLSAGACSHPPADTQPDEDGETAALAHAQCMREHGFDWPDPVLEDGGWDIRFPDGLDPDTPTYREAEVECQEVFESAVPRDEGEDPEDRALLEQEMERMLAFAACMRDQGVDFPDPVFEEGGISGPAGPLDGDWDAFEAARAICEEQTGEPMP